MRFCQQYVMQILRNAEIIIFCLESTFWSVINVCSLHAFKPFYQMRCNFHIYPMNGRRAQMNKEILYGIKQKQSNTVMTAVIISTLFDSL
jgi:hypothetical protein